MVRAGCTVAAATEQECDRIVSVLLAARVDHPVGAPLGTPEPAVLTARVMAFLTSGAGRVSLASVGGSDIGVAIGRRQEPGLFSESPWYEIEVLYVQPEYRRRGTGRMLLADQLAHAQERGLERIVTQPVSGTRSEARFLSRLGFAALGARRTGEVSQIIRRLEPESPRRGIESLIKRRRALSGMTPPRGIPVGSDQSGPERLGTQVGPAAGPATSPAAGPILGTAAGPTASPPAEPLASPAVDPPGGVQLDSSRQVRRAELMRRSSSAPAPGSSVRTVTSTR